MHENRETSEMPEADIRNRPAGEGQSRTARMHVFEESDSGTVPMNHSNKSGKPQAESEEGSARASITSSILRRLMESDTTRPIEVSTSLFGGFLEPRINHRLEFSQP
jgi:hypothetical protein